MTKRVLEVEVHREPDGMWAKVPELGDCFAMGDTFDELVRSLEEAIAMCITPDDFCAANETDVPLSEDMDDVYVNDDSELARLLTRVVGLQIEVDYDLRPDNADDPTQPPPRRKRESHRDDWPPDAARLPPPPHRH